ncbi:MAG: ATP-binding cassette domain-containing protein [Nonomuraea sp.]|nr:ATP-binding cassette domain-containing protein [Nonomuraea sp.]
MDLSLKGPQGWVYRGVSFEAEPGSLVCVAGASGSGRTSLLLTLAGRMRKATGKFAVAGEQKPRRIHRVAALAVLPGVNDLEPQLTVDEHARERLTGMGWMTRPTGRKRTQEALKAVGLGGLDTRMTANRLSPVQLTLFGVALALLERPRLLLVDDVGRGVTDERLNEVWEPLGNLPLTVVAACLNPSPHASVVVELPLDRG